MSESMARAVWPTANPIGQCMRVGADTMPCTTVVGVAEDVTHGSLAEDAPNRYYLPIEQFRPAAGYAVMLRMRGDPAASAERLAQAWRIASRLRSANTLLSRQTRDVLPSDRKRLAGIGRLREYPPRSARFHH